MRFTKLFTFATAIGMLFTACNDESESIKAPKEKAETGYATISLEESRNLSRAVTIGNPQDATGKESDIETLEFYIFNADGSRDANEDNNGYVSITAPRTDNTYSFMVEEGSKVILVAANMSLGQLSGQNKAAVEATIYNRAGQSSVLNPTNIGGEVIPMAGVGAGAVAAGDVADIRIPVARLYSRFDAPTAPNVTVDIDPQSDDYEELKVLLGQPITGTIKFDLTGYYVTNGLKTSFAFPNYGVAEYNKWDAAIWTIGNDMTNYINASYTSEGQLISAYTGNSFLGLDNTGAYLFENTPLNTTIDGVAGFDRNSVYALIIEADLYDSDNAANKVTRYWRINVSKTEKDNGLPVRYQILRNSIYNVKINNVKTIGFGTPGEADEDKKVIPDEDDAAINAIISVAQWNVFNEEVDI